MAHNGRLIPPFSVIESWPAPNFVDPQVKHGLLPACVILSVFSVMAVSARFYARAVILRNLGADDWMLLAAMIPTLGLAIGIILAGEKYKFGYHVWDVVGATFVPERKLAFALELLYLLSTAMSKLSILLFYLRLSAGPTLTKPFRRLVYVTMVFVVMYFTAYMLALFLSCRPLRAYWLSFDFLWGQTHEYYCDNQGASLLAATSTSVLVDFIIVLLPILLLWHLEIAKKQKIALAGLFGMGLFTCLAGLVRIRYVYVAFFQSWDATWVLYDLWIWTAVEALMATICASAPALKVFFRNKNILPTFRPNHKTSASTSATASFHQVRSPFPDQSRAATPPAHSLPSSSGTGSENTDDTIMLVEDKGVDAENDARVTSRELRHYKSIDAVSSIGSIRQPPPQHEQKAPKVTLQEEKKTPKLGFDSIACYGRHSHDGDFDKLRSVRSVRSVDLPREGRIGIKRGNSFDNVGARSRASLLGEVRIERLVEVMLEDGDGGQTKGRDDELTFR